MRNLHKYPITLEEIEECLRKLAAELDDPENIGDIRPVLLIEAAKIVQRVDFVTYGIKRRELENK